MDCTNSMDHVSCHKARSPDPNGAAIRGEEIHLDRSQLSLYGPCSGDFETYYMGAVTGSRFQGKVGGL